MHAKAPKRKIHLSLQKTICGLAPWREFLLWLNEIIFFAFVNSQKKEPR
jgi:hypothetical protein